MTNAQTVIEYRGDFTFETMDQVLNRLRASDIFDQMPKPVRKRLYSALAESMDNIYKYAAHDEDLIRSGEGVPLIAVEQCDEEFSIRAGNLIRNEEISDLRFKIDRVNQLDMEALKSLYEDVITREAKPTDRGAGLGLITMAMRTNHEIAYCFEPINEEFAFFSMQIIIKG
ncbi:MAG: SiaB family protein kinase [Bacteroidales bacterium]